MVKMASLWAHDAGVTLGEFDKTGVTEPLTKTFLGTAATVNAVNITYMLNGDSLAYSFVKRDS